MTSPTNTVYSWATPITEDIIATLAMPHHVATMREREQEAWTKKQDDMHVTFKTLWTQWVSPLVTLPQDILDWAFYPTAGSSEAIRESLHMMGHLGEVLHIFKGEYEGYKAYARTAGVVVVEHDRTDWRNSLTLFTELEQADRHIFYLSEPSSIDGNWWEDFTEFSELLNASAMRLRLDLCYVGICTPPPSTRTIEAEMIFFSLSKVFGVYYHRIGGVFTRTPMSGLWGNKWFKNLRSLYLGELLMRQLGPQELHNTYQALQADACNELGCLPSDVLLLGHQPDSTDEQFIRAEYTARYGLTPMLADREHKGHGDGPGEGLHHAACAGEDSTFFVSS